MKNYALALSLLFSMAQVNAAESCCPIFIAAFQVMSPKTGEVIEDIDNRIEEDARRICSNCSMCSCPYKMYRCGCGVIPALLCVSCGYEAAQGCRCCIMEQPKK